MIVRQKNNLMNCLATYTWENILPQTATSILCWRWASPVSSPTRKKWKPHSTVTATWYLRTFVWNMQIYCHQTPLKWYNKKKWLPRSWPRYACHCGDKAWRCTSSSTNTITLPTTYWSTTAIPVIAPSPMATVFCGTFSKPSKIILTGLWNVCTSPVSALLRWTISQVASISPAIKAPTRYSTTWSDSPKPKYGNC